MSNNSRHHYIPKFYLRNWAVDANRRQIGTYCLKSARTVSRASIRTQAQRPKFYNSDGMEMAFSKSEAEWARVIQEIIRKKSWPQARGGAMIDMIFFVVLQAFRTPQAVDNIERVRCQMNSALVEMGVDDQYLAKESIGPITSGITISLALDTIPIAMDLAAKILVAPPGCCFITSDHPVVLYNQFLEKRDTFGGITGWGSRGLQVFVPLSPDCLLVLFDSEVYKVGGRRLTATRVGICEEDVDTVNRLQIANAYEQVFFSPTMPKGELHKYVNHGLAWRPSGRVATAVIPQGRWGGDGDLLHTQYVSLRVGLSFRAICELPSASALAPELTGTKLRPYSRALFEARRKMLKEAGPLTVRMARDVSQSNTNGL